MHALTRQKYSPAPPPQATLNSAVLMLDGHTHASYEPHALMPAKVVASACLGRLLLTSSIGRHTLAAQAAVVEPHLQPGFCKGRYRMQCFPRWYGDRIRQ